MWYEVTVEYPGGALAQYEWPAAATGVPFPEPSMWNDVTTGGEPCAQGVSIAPTQIFTDQSPDAKIAVDAPNVLHATPRNGTGNPIAGNAIMAHFRIADWSSASFDSPTWRNINSSCNTAAGAEAPVADGGNFDLTCTWTLSEQERCRYRPDLYSSCSPMPDPRHQHQCIWVELTSTAEVLFSSVSACRDMQFAPASWGTDGGTTADGGASDGGPADGGEDGAAGAGGDAAGDASACPDAGDPGPSASCPAIADGCSCRAPRSAPAWLSVFLFARIRRRSSPNRAA